MSRGTSFRTGPERDMVLGTSSVGTATGLGSSLAGPWSTIEGH